MAKSVAMKEKMA
jgi:hypothetical protein